MISARLAPAGDQQQQPPQQNVPERGGCRSLPSRALFLSSLLITFGVPFHYGYQLTVISPVQSVMVQFVNGSVNSHYTVQLNRYGAEAIWGASVASLSAGAIPGALFTQFVADNFGRKRGIILTNAVTALCAALWAASKFLNSIELFAACRFLLGFSVMIGLGISSVFLTECSPLHCRGGIGTLTSIMIECGCIVGAVLAMPNLLGDQAHWWLLFLLEAIMLIVCTVMTMFTLHESPSFLMFRGQQAKAVDAVQFYWGQNEPVNAILDEICTEQQSSRSNTMGMLAVLNQKTSISTQCGLWIGIFLGLSMPLCGVVVIDAYIVEVLQRTLNLSILSSSLIYIGFHFFGLCSLILSSLLVDRIGRRPLLFTSFALIFCANIGISLILYIKRQSLLVNVALIVLVLLHNCAMCCGVFPLSYFVSNEIVPQCARSAVQGWSKLADSVSRSLVLAAYLPVRNVIGDGQAYALFFLPALTLIGIYLYFVLPETKNKSLLAVEHKLVAKMRGGRAAKGKVNRQQKDVQNE